MMLSAFYWPRGGEGEDIACLMEVGARRWLWELLEFLLPTVGTRRSSIVAIFGQRADQAAHGSNYCLCSLIVETDASEVIRLVTSTVGDRSSLSFLVEETKHLILEHSQIKLVHIKRSQNLVSHTMASFSRSEKRSAVWLQ